MVAVLETVAGAGTEGASPGSTVVLGTHPQQAGLLTPAALAFLAGLHRRFEPARQQQLAARRQRQAAFDAGVLPDFRADTAWIRSGDWRVAPLPDALLDRRVEITGPTDPKMVINALNSGASCYMADFEDATAPTWDNLVTGQRALRQAVAGTLEWRAPGDNRPGSAKHYALRPFAAQAVLLHEEQASQEVRGHVRLVRWLLGRLDRCRAARLPARVLLPVAHVRLADRHVQGSVAHGLGELRLFLRVSPPE